MISLSNIEGEVPLKVVLRNPQGGEANFENKVRADNREVVLDLVMQLDNLALPAMGRYSFEVWSGDEFLAARHFNVSLVQQNQGVAPGFPQSGEVGSA